MNEIASDFSLRFTIAYAMALMPALIVRFAWKRGPLKPSTAAWIAGSSCLVLFGISRPLLTSSDPQIMQSGLMWALAFVVSQAIMTGGYRRSPAPPR